MIKFLVSKGIFSLEGEKFNPYESLTRYDFTTALVKMFYVLDRNAKTTFIDVEENNFYYPYIASAETEKIALGIGDNLFAGEQLVTKEQVITFASRTLMDKKGYGISTNPQSYANFTDKQKIANWALDHIIFAEEVGLIDGGGELNPKGDITRLESAEILYRLYMMLYEVSPEKTTVEINSKNNYLLILGSIVGFTAILGLGTIFIFKKRKIK